MAGKILLKEDVIAAIHAHIKHEKNAPSVDSGAVLNFPKFAGLTWLTVVTRMNEGNVAGVPAGTTFGDFKTQIGVTTSATKSSRRLGTTVDVQNLTDAFVGYIRDNGVRPMNTKGDIAHGDLAGKISWDGLTSVLQTGKKVEPPVRGAEFMDVVHHVLDALQAHGAEVDDGKNRGRGLTKVALPETLDTNAVVKTLTAQFRKSAKYIANRPAPKLMGADLYRHLVMHVDGAKMLDVCNDPAAIVAGHTVEDINRAFAQKTVDMTGMKKHTDKTEFTSLADFAGECSLLPITIKAPPPKKSKARSPETAAPAAQHIELK